MSRRTALHLLGSTVVAVSVAVAGAGTALADGGGKGYRNGGGAGYTKPGTLPGKVKSADAHCAFSLHGESWTAAQGLAAITPTADGKINLDVMGSGGSCTVSLASYQAHGPTFATSGLQVLTGFATVTVRRGATESLTIAVPDAGCFAQIDLYKGSTRFDGGTGTGHGPAPEGPDGAVIGTKLIAAWNGPVGGKDCINATPTPTPSATTPTSTPTTPGTAPTTPAVPSTAPAVPTGTPSTPSTPSSPSTSGAAVPPAATPAATPTGDDTHLASTGSDNTGLLAGSAGALLLAGGGVLFALRRRNAARHG